MKGERADYLATNELQTPYGHKTKDSKHLGEGRDKVGTALAKKLVIKKGARPNWVEAK